MPTRANSILVPAQTGWGPGRRKDKMSLPKKPVPCRLMNMTEPGRLLLIYSSLRISSLTVADSLK